MNNVRIFWFFLILSGAGTVVVGSNLKGQGSSVRTDSLQGDNSELLGFAQSTGLDMTGAGIAALGGIFAFMGIIGLARTFREDRSEEEPGLPADVLKGLSEDATTPAEVPKLDEPTDAEILRRLAWPSMQRDEPLEQEARKDDPTTWRHPEGILFLFNDRDPLPFYGLVRDLAVLHLSSSGLLLARLDASAGPGRSLVAVLGNAKAVEAFDDIYRQFAGLEFGARGLNPSKTKPQATLQARSYDPAWVVPNAAPYQAERDALRRGAYLLRDLTPL